MVMYFPLDHLNTKVRYFAYYTTVNDMTIAILDIIRRTVFYFKLSISETGLFPSPVRRQRLALSIGAN
jgi:hypothetical protein